MKLWSNIISIFGNILELDAGEKNPIEKNYIYSASGIAGG
jgi:hypothetical protein